MVKVQDSVLEASGFKLLSFYNVPIRYNSPVKGMYHLIYPVMY